MAAGNAFATAAGGTDDDAIACGRERQALGAQFEAHAFGQQDRADAVGYVGVLARQQPRRALDYRHGGA